MSLRRPNHISESQVHQIKQKEYCMRLALSEARGENIYALNESNCKCPFHDDEHASAGFYQDPHTKSWLFTCHACDWNKTNGISHSGDAIAVLQMARRQKGIDLDFSLVTRIREVFLVREVSLTHDIKLFLPLEGF